MWLRFLKATALGFPRGYAVGTHAYRCNLYNERDNREKTLENNRSRSAASDAAAPPVHRLDIRQAFPR